MVDSFKHSKAGNYSTDDMLRYYRSMGYSPAGEEKQSYNSFAYQTLMNYNQLCLDSETKNKV